MKSMKDMKVRCTDSGHCAKIAFSNSITQKVSAYAGQKTTQVLHFMAFMRFMVNFNCRI